MKKTFKNKIMGFAGVFLMTMMLVVASGVYPNPFVSDNEVDVAIVYGASAAGTDATAAESIVNSLANGINVPNTLDRILSDGVTEDEIVLGSSVYGIGKIRATLTDNQISSLFDGKIEWYDGTDTDSYNVHEELVIGNEDDGFKIETTLDNNDFEGQVVLTNNKALAYRYIFDEDVFEDYADLTAEDAEALEVTILGKEYLIEDVTSNSITVTDADEGIFKIGDTFTANGKTFTIDDIYDDAISVNSIFIKEGKKKTIDDIQVKVDTIYYKDSLTLPSKVKLYYGGEISQEYNDGDGYIGENEDDPEWVWSINEPGKVEGYIGVRYDLKQTDEEDDVVYEGGEYIFPNDFAAVSFDELTDVDYFDYEVYFDDVVLYNNNGDDNENGDKISEDDINVIVIGTDEDGLFELSDSGYESDALYLRYVEGNDAVDPVIQIYYMDLDKDFSKGKPVWYSNISLDESVFNVGLVKIDETEMTMSVSEDGNNLSMTDVNNNIIKISLGEEDDDDDGTVSINGKSIRSEDNDVMDYYGTIIESPESNMDDDRVVLKVPSEQVYAQISVSGSEEDSSVVVNETTSAELGIAKVTDGQVPADKNIIVVGGSCINTMAANLLGGKFCGAEFTAKTGVGAGQFLIQTFDRGDGKVVTLVAGYNAADTTKGVAHLLSNNLNIAVGEKVIM